MHFTAVFRTSQLDPSSVANSRLASLDISNVQNANVHARIHSSTHTSTAFMPAVATPSPRLSRHALVFVPSEMIRENGNLRRYCMEDVHGIIGVKVIKRPYGKPPEARQDKCVGPRIGQVAVPKVKIPTLVRNLTLIIQSISNDY